MKKLAILLIFCILAGSIVISPAAFAKGSYLKKTEDGKYDKLNEAIAKEYERYRAIRQIRRGKREQDELQDRDFYVRQLEIKRHVD